MPRPCRTAKGFDCVFPIWFIQYGRVSFTLAIPRPCHATTMPFWKRLIKAVTQCSISMAWEWHVWISIGRPEMACERPARVRLLPFHEGCYQKHTNPLNCRTNSSVISGYHADFHEGHGTVRKRHGMCELTRHDMGAAWHVWISLKSFTHRSEQHLGFKSQRRCSAKFNAFGAYWGVEV
jgi:hypothetical protein